MPAGLAGLLLAVVAVRFAEPITDGDIFWHLVYGQEMLAARSPVVDHAAFSWMPASNALIYCAWLAEVGLAAVFHWWGFAGLFALRYAAVLVSIGLLAMHAWTEGVLWRAERWLVLLVVVLASVVGTLLKPEMLSLVLWNALAFCGFAAMRGAGLRPLYAMPAILVIWVNTHGAFLLAAPFVAIVLGTAWVVLPQRRRHVIAAGLLCLGATAATPYGWRYPVQLLRESLGGFDRPDIAWNNAFQPTLGAAGQALHLPQLAALMVVILAGLAWGARRRGWSLLPLLAPFAAYLPLDFAYVRATFLLPPLFGYAALTLLPAVRLPRWSPALATALFAAIGVGSVAEAARHPAPGSWLGFGIGTSQPVAEAEFLAREHLGPRILNTYNAGGYLIWRLWPRDRVMVDARSFPYLAWFDELRLFTGTTDPVAFAGFLERHPGDVALVDFQEETVWRSFLRQPGWRPAFYGPAAAVFVPVARAPAAVEAAPTLLALRNGNDGRRLFDFAIAVGDYRTAWRLLEQLESRLRPQVDPGDLRRMQDYRDAHQALAAGQVDRAWDDLAAAFATRPPEGRDLLLLRLLGALRQTGPDDPRAATIRAGLVQLASPP